MSGSNKSKFDTDFNFWKDSDIITVERQKLLARKPGQAVGSQAQKPTLTPAGVTEPPEGEYLVEAVYRYTRSNNDLTNPGMGYGELTSEVAWVQTTQGLKLRAFYVRRTRSARRRVEPAGAPVDAPTSGVTSQYPPAGTKASKT